MPLHPTAEKVVQDANWGTITVVLAGVVAFLGGVAKIVQEMRKQTHDHTQSTQTQKHVQKIETDARTIQEYEKFIERQTQVIEAARKEAHDVRNELNVCNNKMMMFAAKLARAETWIQALEDTLRQKEIPFRPYEPMKDSVASFDIPEGI